MLIRRKRFGISLVLLTCLVWPPVALGQDAASPNRDWSMLKALTSGSKLIAKLKGGKTVEGKLTNVSDTTLSLSVKGKATELNRDQVLTIYRNIRNSAKKGTLVGLGVGAGAGALIGAAGGDPDPHPIFVSKPTLAAGMAILGGGAGAIAGYFIGRSGSKRVLIYEAP